MPPDADAELVERIVAANLGLIRAVHQGDRLRVIGELNRLLAAIIEHRDARPDEALVRAVARLGAAAVR
jgi:hypothetical protein